MNCLLVLISLGLVASCMLVNGQEQDTEVIDQVLTKLNNQEQCLLPSFWEVEKAQESLATLEDAKTDDMKLLDSVMGQEWNKFHKRMISLGVIKSAKKRSFLALVVNYQKAKHGKSICESLEKDLSSPQLNMIFVEPEKDAVAVNPSPETAFCSKVTRDAMIKLLQSGGHIQTEKVLEAMSNVDRCHFCPKDMKPYSEENYVLSGITLGKPSFYAQILEELRGRVFPQAKILHVGPGSGYLTALLAQLVGEQGKVYAVEQSQSMREFAEANVRRDNPSLLEKGVVKFLLANELGLQYDYQPYDIIVVENVVDEDLDVLLSWLKRGGFLLAPIKRNRNGLAYEFIQRSGNSYKLINRPLLKPLSDKALNDQMGQLAAIKT